MVHSAEPSGDGIGRDVWRHIQQASVSYQTGWGRGLLLEAGIFPCHAGFESFPSKDNWNCARSWLGEFSPYYVSGVKGSYSFDGHWSAQLHLLSGWQTIGETNQSKTLGSQLAWAASACRCPSTPCWVRAAGQRPAVARLRRLGPGHKLSDRLSLGQCGHCRRGAAEDVLESSGGYFVMRNPNSMGGGTPR